MIDSDRLHWAVADVQLQRRLPSPNRRRQLRRRSGISQQTIALALGVTRAAVAKYEAGARTPRGAVLRAYVDILDRFAEEPPVEPPDAARLQRRAETTAECRHDRE